MFTFLCACAGSRPSHLGGTQTAFLPCAKTPNCVSSLASDETHVIAPIAFQGDPAEAISRLKDIVNAMPRTRVINHAEHYLYVECKSRLMGFVDDLEFMYLPTKKAIEVKSASRIGYSDMGINRKRVELIRERFQAP